MPGAFYVFVADTGAKTQRIRASEVNDNFKALPPLGSIIPFYDFNGAITIDTNYWAYCDGSVVTMRAIGAQTLPDLSNRYLVGFGTEGGGDIDTAVWATAAVGNASHQVDISHTHAGPSHTHTGTSDSGGVDHTHGAVTSGAGSSHSHGAGTLQFQVGESQFGPTYWGFKMYISNGTATMVIQNNSLTGTGFANRAEIVDPGNTFYTKSGTGSTATESSHTHSVTISTGASAYNHTHTFTTAASGTGATGSGGSATQTIQPRSIRCRFIMRIA